MKNGKESNDIPYMKPFISELKLDALTPVSMPLYDNKIEIKCFTSYEFFLKLFRKTPLKLPCTSLTGL